jgi:archaellum component FlaG (FlaF/FlaG flagellin family)
MLLYFHPADLSASDIILFILVILFNAFVFIGVPVAIYLVFKTSKNKKRRDISKAPQD